MIKFVMSCDMSMASTGLSVSFTNKTDHHDITEILLKVALNTIKQANIDNRASKDVEGLLLALLGPKK